MPQISIITPFRNAEKFIHFTAQSIIDQTYTDWEWILVDDHSDENEEGALQPFLLDSRIKIFKNTGQGIVDALVTGLDISSGEFVTRMDADDLMPFNKLSLFLERLLLKDDEIVTGKVQYFSLDGEVSTGYLNYAKWLNERIDLSDFYPEIYRECTLSSGNWMMRKSHLEKCGGFKDLSYPEDYDLLFRWKKCGYKISGLNEVTHMWREHPERTSRNSSDYAQESFFRMKINYFIQLEKKDMPLILNGTGRKGRLTAQILQKNNILFDWVSIEPEKFRGGVYGLQIHGHDEIAYYDAIQILNAAKIEREDVLRLYVDKNKVDVIVSL